MRHRYDVYATAWNDSRIVEELIPARNLQFSMPLSDHGQASFSATVEPGTSFWRAAITKDVSGAVIVRDDVPVWQGWVTADVESGQREFTFNCKEWGSFFARCPAIPKTYTGWNDCRIFRNQIDLAQLVPGQNAQVNTGSALGSAFSDRTINPWDDTTVEREFTSVASAEGGPEWYFGTTGSIANPIRQLYLADRLGTTAPAAFFEYVEDTAPPGMPAAPMTALLGDLFGVPTVVPTRRAGGNVIAKARTRQSDSTTVAVAIGSGDGLAQIRATATADDLLAAGWPRLTSTKTYSDVTNLATLQRHANADLAAARGIATGWSLVTLDDDPDWTQVPRGSTVTVSIDSDVYAGPRPLAFDTRVLGITVNVPDTGTAQVTWDVATTQGGS